MLVAQSNPCLTDPSLMTHEVCEAETDTRWPALYVTNLCMAELLLYCGEPFSDRGTPDVYSLLNDEGHGIDGRVSGIGEEIAEGEEVFFPCHVA